MKTGGIFHELQPANIGIFLEWESISKRRLDGIEAATEDGILSSKNVKFDYPDLRGQNVALTWFNNHS